MAVSANRLELLQIADAVAREKSIDRQIVLDLDGGRHPESGALPLRPGNRGARGINPKTGEIRFSRLLLVVDEIENDAIHITLNEGGARRIRRRRSATGSPRRCRHSIFGRIAAQSAKAGDRAEGARSERDRQYQGIQGSHSAISSMASSSASEYGNVIIDLGRGEATIRRDDMIPREMFRPGDRGAAPTSTTCDANSGARRLFLSRTHPQFMAKLFQQEVPGNLRQHQFRLKSVARDPGSRAKIAVISRDAVGSIRSAPASACAARESRPSSMSCRAKRSTSFPGRRNAATSSSTRCSRPRSSRSCSTRIPHGIEVVVPDDHYHWRSVGAARTCASPRS